MEQDILVFEIDDRQFGLPADAVIEVVRAVTPMPVPRSPSAIMGIINLRGRVVPVINTRDLLRMQTVDVRHTDHLIIVRDDRLTYAIHADRAIDLLDLGPNSKATGGGKSTGDAKETGNADPKIGLICNTAIGMVQILQPSELLGDQERSALKAIATSSTPSEITE